MLTFDEFSLSALALIALGGFSGGVVNGLAGFGTALASMPLWLNAVPTLVASQLAAAGGVCGQMLSLRTAWRDSDLRALAPMLLGGLAGVPIGTLLVPLIDQLMFKRGVGVCLVVFAAIMLAVAGRWQMRPYGRGAELLVGVFSGILGGVAGLSGVLPTLWAALQGWSKTRRRAVFLTFNFTILAAMLLAHAARGLITPLFVKALLIALPGTLMGFWLGSWVFTRLDDRRFDQVVLVLLGAAGIALLATTP